MSTRHRSRLITTTFLFYVLFLSASVCFGAVTNTWDGSESTDWFTDGNWSDSVPAAGHHVVITNAGNAVLLTNSTANLASFNITSNTLTFTNWITTLTASNVAIQSGGTLTLPAAFTESQMSNRVHVVCTNFILELGGIINVDVTGYADAQGPGKGVSGTYAGGAGYGGKGGDGQTFAGGPTYGLTNAPVGPGSGGGTQSGTYPGGKGGGAVRIEAEGGVVVNGTIRADGNNGIGHAGGGSGGAIFITCQTFEGGTNGILSAGGGNYSDMYKTGGGGGGGRIAVGIGFSDDAISNLLSGENVPGLYIYENHATFAGTISVTNGAGWYNPPHEKGAYPGTRIFMTTNYCLTVTGDPAEYDGPTPFGYGTYTEIAGDTWITNTVSSPVDQANGMRHTCFGWDLANTDGISVSNGTSTQAVFQLTNTLILTWNWTNEYELTVSAATNGTVTTNVNDWYTNSVEVSGISATGSVGYMFFVWTGDVPWGQETNNPLTVTMDQARTIVGNFCSTTGVVKTWTGSGNWISSTNWSPEGMPGPYDDVIIQSGSILLDIPTSMKSLTVSNATLTFTNWSTTLNASNVTVQSGGAITLPVAFTDSQMSNRVHIVCTNFTLESGGQIDAVGKGYAGGSAGGAGYGPGGTQGRAGAGYGGKGGDGYTGTGGGTYGSTNAPLSPGSGGGSDQQSGGDGGGAIRIEATGIVKVYGTITADGASGDANWTGAGSGGGIFITCNRFDGSTNGILSADGGTGDGYMGGGGGGRIAVLYNGTAQTNRPGVRFSTTGGDATGENGSCPGEMGTVYFPDNALLSETQVELFMDVLLFIPGFTNWSVNSLTMSNCVVTFGTEGLQLNVTNDVHIGSGGRLTLLTNSAVSCGGSMTLSDGGSLCVYGGGTTNSTISCGGSMILTNGSSLYVYSGMTNGLGVDYGALVSMTGDVEISSSSWIYPYSHSTDGGSVLFRMGNLGIATNGGFNADTKGYSGGKGSSGYGPGAGSGRSGGGYGGKGGNGDSGTGGSTYGSTNAPVDPGSGGGSLHGSYWAGSGGGAVRIEAAGTVTANGTITANGGNGSDWLGGGSGGGIFITCGTFVGDINGILNANGGNGTVNYGGGGGGGRIAIWYGVPEDRRAGILDGTDMLRVSITTNASDYSGFLGTVFVTNGTGYTSGDPAGPGTCIFLTVTPPSGTMFMCQ